MRILFVVPLMNPIIVDIESTLQAKQKLVGGPIEVLRFTLENDAVSSIILYSIHQSVSFTVIHDCTNHVPYR